jgi:hypothetical protein
MTKTCSERLGASDDSGNDLPPGPPGFLSAYPGYRSTALLDQLRATEYSYLDASGHVYLDYAGAGLPAPGGQDEASGPGVDGLTGCRSTLTAPVRREFFSTSTASVQRSSGKRCVMTGVRSKPSAMKSK